jgi:hypothetical protein
MAFTFRELASSQPVEKETRHVLQGVMGSVECLERAPLVGVNLREPSDGGPRRPNRDRVWTGDGPFPTKVQQVSNKAMVEIRVTRWREADGLYTRALNQTRGV